MRTALLALALAACDTTKDDDTGTSDGDLPGLDTDSWVFAADPPQDGDGVQYQIIVGGIDAGSTVDAHWTEVFTLGSTGEVLCAYTYTFSGSAPASDSGCEHAWSGTFSLPGGYGAEHCTTLLGYDPFGKGLSHLVGLGYSTDGTVCLEEDGYGWDAFPESTYTDVGDGGFLLIYEQAYFYKE